MFNLNSLTRTSPSSPSENNGLMYKPHPRFLAQKVRLIYECLRYLQVAQMLGCSPCHLLRSRGPISLKDRLCLHYCRSHSQRWLQECPNHHFQCQFQQNHLHQLQVSLFPHLKGLNSQSECLASLVAGRCFNKAAKSIHSEHCANHHNQE